MLTKAHDAHTQGEKSRFVIYDQVVDKYGNKPFWGGGPVALEIRSAFMHVHMHAYMHASICVHVCMDVYSYVHMHVYAHIYVC